MEKKRNLWVIPTDKPSRFYFNNNDKCFQLCKVSKKSTPLKINQNIYITNDKEIKEGDWYYNKVKKSVHKCDSKDNGMLRPNHCHIYDCKKIILTTDQDLIKDGVQSIDDEFLKWFVNNPSCESVEVENERVVLDDVNYNFDVVEYNYKIIIPKEEPKQETLEEAAEKWVFETNGHKWSNNDDSAGDNYSSFKEGAKWQQEQDKIKFKNYPVIIVRNDDKEEFIHLSNGMYRTKWGILHDSISSTPLESFDKSKFTFYYE